jgi:cytochrome c553
VRALHRPDNMHAAPLLHGLPANYLLKQFALYKSGKRFGPAMQTNLSPFSIEDWHDIAEFFSSRPPTRAVTKLNADRQTEEICSTIANSYGCANCHGSDYRGTKDVPRLAGGSCVVIWHCTLVGCSAISIFIRQCPASGRPIPPADVEAMATYLEACRPERPKSSLRATPPDGSVRTDSREPASNLCTACSAPARVSASPSAADVQSDGLMRIAAEAAVRWWSSSGEHHRGIIAAKAELVDRCPSCRRPSR